MFRYPFTPYPRGWFCVAYSHEVPRGGKLRVQRLGRELLIFRGDDGIARVCDAYCPHLGADLGVGSKVIGDTIECSFHGWRFDGRGECVKIPYCNKIPPKAKIRSWPACEKDGNILFYYDPEGRCPAFEVPKAPFRTDVRWGEPMRFSWKIRLHIQEIAENALDTGHFPKVHAYSKAPKITRFDIDGPRFSVDLDTDRHGIGFIGTTPMTISYHGFGVVHANLTTFLGRKLPFELAVVLTTTPIDEEHCDVRIVARYPLSRIPWQAALRPLVLHEISVDFANDIPIWESKQYLKHPVLCKDDGPIGKIRSWAKQFYTAEVGTAAVGEVDQPTAAV